MAQGGQQGQADNTMAPILIACLVLAFVSITWFLKHTWIVKFIFQINIYQAYLVNLLWPGDPLNNVILYMQTVDASAVHFNTMVNVTMQVGLYTRYIYLAILGFLAFMLYQKDIRHKFCKVYSMKTLSKQEQENWPAISPVINEDLIKTDIDVGPWAMALNPMEMCRKYHLLKKNDVLLDPNLPGQEMTASIKKTDAKRIFTMQLGPLWEGFERCQPHVRALAAIFLARINRDRDVGRRIASRLSQSYAIHKIDYAEVDDTIKKYQACEEVEELTQKHAYVYTFMASLIEKARLDGVVPSAEFLWLKPVDRRLWYMLNCVGRQTPYAEIAGAFAHWKAEKAMQRRALTPMVDEATKALELAVKDVKLTEKELRNLPS